MAASDETASMALFCDFENVALGVRDAKYEKFDIRPVLERLLAKGSIVVKKAYCDWDRYKGFKAAMHEANFELIEIPHVRQSGKNSADIRLVVDALDLCYTKSHVNTFVIISGDSDFSPLVSKLRENAKRVIGVGVKQSCSDLLIANCDEFIYYDDLVRERNGARRESREAAAPRRSPEEERSRGEKMEARKAKAVDLVAATFADLIADRGESERIWASVLKEVVKRRNPGFNESYFGFRSFGNLLEEAAQRGLLGFGRDDKGAYVFRAPARTLPPEAEGGGEPVRDEPIAEPVAQEAAAGEPEAVSNGRRRGGRRGRGKERDAPEMTEAMPPAGAVPAIGGEAGALAGDRGAVAVPEAAAPEEAPAAGRRRGGSRRGRKETPEQAPGAAAPSGPGVTIAVAVEAPGEPAAAAAAEESAASAKPRRGGRRPRQGTAAQQVGAMPAPVSEPAPAALEQPAAPKRAAQTPRSRKPKAAAG